MKDGNAEKLSTPPPELKLAVAAPLAAASQKKVEMSTTLQQQWNTKNLGLRLGADAASAACAAGLVAPLISIIDR